MSYDLHFWNQMSDCALEPGDVLEQLGEGTVPTGIAPIASEEIIERIRFVFPAISEESTVTFMWESGDECFLVTVSQYYMYVESHGAHGDTLNKLIDIAVDFNCRLYDPQTGVRYSGD